MVRKSSGRSSEETTVTSRSSSSSTTTAFFLGLDLGATFFPSMARGTSESHPSSSEMTTSTALPLPLPFDLGAGARGGSIAMGSSDSPEWRTALRFLGLGLVMTVGGGDDAGDAAGNSVGG